MGTFSDLPKEIVELVSRKMSHDDFLQFGGVCKASRSVYLENHRNLPDKLPMSLCLPRPVGVPLLLLSCKEDASSVDITSITDEANRTTIEIPERVNKWYCGSSCGWLIAVDIFGKKNLQLLNPITRDVIMLPPLSSFQRVKSPIRQLDHTPLDQFWHVYKVILSAAPQRSSKDSTVMAIVDCDQTLSFCKLGSDKWVNVHGSPFFVSDIVYNDNKFYVVNSSGLTFSCEEDGNGNYGVKIIAEKPFLRPNRPIEHRRYLVASQGVLLQIERRMWGGEKDGGAGRYHETIGFNVFELRKRILPVSLYAEGATTKGWIKELNAEYQWVEKKSLGDEMVFLGLNCSISLPARLYPNCRGNSIYFTDDEIVEHLINFQVRNVVPDLHHNIVDHVMMNSPEINAISDLHHDVGVYNMEDKTVRRFNLEGVDELIPPIWVMPNPWQWQ